MLVAITSRFLGCAHETLLAFVNVRYSQGGAPESFKGEVKAKIKISPVVVFGVLSRMVVVRGS